VYIIKLNVKGKIVLVLAMQVYEGVEVGLNTLSRCYMEMNGYLYTLRKQPLVPIY
jgi:hypothetical protein